MTRVPILLCLCLSGLVLAAPPVAAVDHDPITAADLLEHIEVLASDAFAGREAGSDDERRAADYLVSVLSGIEGLVPGGEEGTWFQTFRMPGVKDVHARNVIALLPGSDPELAAETIVIGAHYDHVGRGGRPDARGGRQIHNGADDNASGTAGVLELAASLASRQTRPRRTIAFQLYSGEEAGLIGSLHYTRNPLRPLADTVFMLNMDMIGRLRARALLIGGTGTSPAFSERARRLCTEHGLVLIEEPVGNAPSDNASFFMVQIPTLFLFTGVHADYHDAGDDTHLVNVEGAADIVRLAEDFVRDVDAADARPEFVFKGGQASYWQPAPWVGAVFGPTWDAPVGQAQVDMVFEDSPAERAGLQVGDLVLALGDRTLPSLKAIEELLGLDNLLDPETLLLKELPFTVLRPDPAGEGEPESLSGMLVPEVR